jgi:hypothetical protein
MYDSFPADVASTHLLSLTLGDVKENKNHNIKTCIFNIGRLTSVLTVTQNHNSLHNPTRLPFTIYLNWTTYLNLLFYLLGRHQRGRWRVKRRSVWVVSIFNIFYECI